MKGPYQFLYMMVNQLWIPLMTTVFHFKETLHCIGIGNMLLPCNLLCCVRESKLVIVIFHTLSTNKSTNNILILFAGLLDNHCVKSVLIWSYSGPYFLALGLNTDRYAVSLCIQSESGKIWTRITPNKDTFYPVNAEQSNVIFVIDWIFHGELFTFLLQTLRKKWSFDEWRISSVNGTKSAGNWGLGHIYWRNP